MEKTLRKRESRQSIDKQSSEHQISIREKFQTGHLRWVLLIHFVRFWNYFRGQIASWRGSVASYVTESAYNLSRKESKRWQNVNPKLLTLLTVGICRTHLNIHWELRKSAKAVTFFCIFSKKRKCFLLELRFSAIFALKQLRFSAQNQAVGAQEFVSCYISVFLHTFAAEISNRSFCCSFFVPVWKGSWKSGSKKVTEGDLPVIAPCYLHHRDDLPKNGQ